MRERAVPSGGSPPTDPDRVRLSLLLDGSPGKRRFVGVFGAVMVLTAGSAFLFKLIEFVAAATAGGPSALGSFLIPVLTYLIVAAGFFCLFLWAWAAGQFRDLEAPKYRMLEMQREIDAAEAAGRGRAGGEG